jgi:hypothetical protein
LLDIREYSLLLELIFCEIKFIPRLNLNFNLAIT